MIGQVAGTELVVETAGGGPDGGLGTSPDRVSDGISRADRGEGVVVIGDLGSSLLAARHILEDLDDGDRVRLADAPFVEGAIAASVVAAGGGSMQEVISAAESARNAHKF